MKKQVIFTFLIIVIMVVFVFFTGIHDTSNNARGALSAENESRQNIKIQDSGDINIKTNSINTMAYSLSQLRQMYPPRTKWEGEWEGGIECVGYALRLCYLYNGGVSTYTFGISKDVNDLKVGTMVRYKCGAYDHSIFITGISGETVYYTDANYDLRGTIRWDLVTTKSEIARWINQPLNQVYDVKPQQYSTTGFILCYDKRIITYDISECDIYVSDVDRYKGETEPVVIVKHNGNVLLYGTHYTFYYAYRGDDGGTIVIRGEEDYEDKVNYEGEVTIKYKVIRVDLSKCTATYENRYQYTGDVINPENITVTNYYGQVVDESFYRISYSLYPIEPKVYTFKIWPADGQDIYEGYLQLEYEIVPREISKCEIIYDKSVKFTGGELTPAVKIMNNKEELILGVDYTVTYKNNIDVGVGKIIISAKRSYYIGECEMEFDIYVEDHEIFVH